jgi:hypothetical protein
MQIMQLEKHLKDQQVVRGALEKALGPDAAPVNLSPENPMPKVIFFCLRRFVNLPFSQYSPLIRLTILIFSGC